MQKKFRKFFVKIVLVEVTTNVIVGVSYDVIKSFVFLNQTGLRSKVKVFTSEYNKNAGTIAA